MDWSLPILSWTLKASIFEKLENRGQTDLHDLQCFLASVNLPQPNPDGLRLVGDFQLNLDFFTLS